MGFTLSVVYPFRPFCRWISVKLSTRQNCLPLLPPRATTQALRSESSKIAIYTDSSHVYGGASGSARHWKVRGWKDTKGVVVLNIELWDSLID
mmetsp:Transcript_127872/g.220994  ORF Transcript_127872/g.220994 Transcript_127872/m.220994 type:complete len:93 (-) Transcript_127872:102-380(-)